MAEPETDDRIAELRLLWESDPSSKAYLQLAEAYRQRGDVDQAVEVLETSLEHRPRDPRGRVALSRCRLDQGRPAEAAALLEEVTTQDPAHTVANKLLVEAYLQDGDADKARSRLDIYRLLNDRDPELEHLEYRLEALRAGESVADAAPTENRPVDGPSLDERSSGGEEPATDREPEPVVVAAAPETTGAARLGASADAPPSARDGVVFDLEPLAAPSLDDLWRPTHRDATPVADEPFADLLSAPPPRLVDDGPLDLPDRPSTERAVESAAVESAAVESAAVESAAVESPAGEPPRVEPPAAEPVAAEPVALEPAAPEPVETEPSPEIEPSPEAEPSPEIEPAPEIQSAPQVQSDAASPTATLGMVYLEQGHTAEAERIFRQVLVDDPNNAVAREGLARLDDLESVLGGKDALAAAEDAPAGPLDESLEIEDAPEPGLAPSLETDHHTVVAAVEPGLAPPEEPPADRVEAPIAAASPASRIEASRVDDAEPSVPESAGPESAGSESAGPESRAPKTGPAAPPGPPLQAADLLADRALDQVPAGLTAKKILVLEQYRQHLRRASQTHVS